MTRCTCRRCRRYRRREAFKIGFIRGLSYGFVRALWRR